MILPFKPIAIQVGHGAIGLHRTTVATATRNNWFFI
jgi:hypothetical protein